jgi:two-component system sensor histidine kinase KdpD
VEADEMATEMTGWQQHGVRRFRHYGQRPAWWREGFPAPYALPAGFAAMFAVGTVAAALNGRLPGVGVLIACAVIVVVLATLAEPAAAVPLGVIGWLTVIGFSRPPYADLRPTGTAAVNAAATMAVCALAGPVAGLVLRHWARATHAPRGGTLESVDRRAKSGTPARRQYLLGGRPPRSAFPGGTPRTPAAPGGGLTGRRQVAGAVLAVAGLPLLTLLLWVLRAHLDLSNDLLIYLVAVVAVTVVGGFWPAVFAAVAASMLLNWFFTEPLHAFTIAEPKNLLALVLFVTVAVAVSSVVHLAARREADAARSAKETSSLLGLAQTVLGGADTPGDVLDHLTSSHGGHAELLERVSGRWIKVASSGPPGDGMNVIRFEVRPDLALEVSGQSESATTSLLAGYTAQAVAALDRARLRTQAAQAEALAEGNRMRDALLAAVSHDLRTPLASIKASVSSLRQTDVHWSADDEADLLATIESNADRLDALVGNLLDMSRLRTGSIAPFLRATAVDEVAPVALRGLDGAETLSIVVPDDLPLVMADPGLLERVLANLFSNALRYSPDGQPPELRAREDGDRVLLEVTDRGPGVPDDLKDQLFEPFRRLDERSSVGLGLAVAKGFAEAMGGTITPLDTPGGGLTMRVSLPAQTSGVRAGLGAQA